MKRKTRALSVVAVGACLLAAGARPALSAAVLCPMGGTMVAVEVDKGQALAWAAGLSKKDVSGADTADWTVLTLCRTDAGIALLVGPGYVFLGVAGRGGEVYPRDMEQAFGKDLGRLRAALRETVTDLRKAGVVKISGDEVQTLVDAAGIGSVERDGSGWVVKTRDCQAVDLPAAGL